MPETMMALRAHARGGAEQLVYEPTPVPDLRAAWAIRPSTVSGISRAVPRRSR